MFKEKLKLIIATLVFSTIACTNSFASLYLGAGIGIRPLTVEFSKFSVVGVQIQNITLAVTKPAGDIFLGYDHLFQNRLYLGAEAFYEYTNLQQSYIASVTVLGVNITENVSASLSDNIGGKIYIGFEPSKDIVFYVDVGALVDELYYSASQNILSITTNKTRGEHIAAAGTFGLGMLYKILDRLSLRAEYNYMRYPNKNVEIDVSVPAINASSSIKFTPKAAINAVTLSLLYRFSL